MNIEARPSARQQDMLRKRWGEGVIEPATRPHFAIHARAMQAVDARYFAGVVSPNLATPGSVHSERSAWGGS